MSTHFQNQRRTNNSQLCVFMSSVLPLLLTAGLVAFMVLNLTRPAECSIGYFEHYGWPTYGIVKPFWMTPFSAFPSRAISGYSRKHAMYNGRGLLRFKDY